MVRYTFVFVIITLSIYMMFEFLGGFTWFRGVGGDWWRLLVVGVLN